MRTRPERLKDVHGFSIDRVAEAAEADPGMLRLDNLDTDLRPPDSAVGPTRDISDELGYSQAPVVVADDHNHWSGFRPDLIDRLV